MSLLVSLSAFYATVIGIFTEAIDVDATAIDNCTEAIVYFPFYLIFCLVISVHQRVQSTSQGTVFFVDQVLQVELFLSPGYKLKDEEDGTVYSDGGGGLRPVCP